MYTKTLTKTIGEEDILMMPRISTPIGRRAIYCFSEESFPKGVRHLPIDSLVDIQLDGLSVESSGQIKFTHPWHSVGNPFIGTGVEPQNHLSGNLQKDLGIFGQFKKLVVDQGKKLNLSFCIEGPFSDAFSTDENRTRFIDSVLELCRAYPIFNGLLIGWFVIARQNDGENFILVLEGLRSALPLGFVIGIAASRIPTKAKWPIERASHLVDQIHLAKKKQLTIDPTCIQIPIKIGVMIKLLNTTYQEGLILLNSLYPLLIGFWDFSKADDIGKPAKVGLPNAIDNLCPSELVGHGFVERWDDKAKAPYAYHPEKRLIYVYDNAKSIRWEVAYIKANNLGGVYMSPCPGAKACSMLKIVHDRLTHG